MEMSNWDACEASEIPRQLHLRGPDGLPMVDGDKPVIVLHKGASAPSVQAAVLDYARKQMTAPKVDDPLVPLIMHEDSIRKALLLITGFQNMERDGKPCTAADAEWVLRKTMWKGARGADGKLLRPSFAQQVLEAAESEPDPLLAALTA